MNRDFFRIALGWGSLALMAVGVLCAALDKPLAWAYVVAAICCIAFVSWLGE